MSRPRLLDLFAGAGGAAMGYHRAGFDVVGVDIAPSPRYPFECYKDEALRFLAEEAIFFDAIHASPPCHDHSTLAARSGADGTGWMLHQTIELCEATGLPYVVENVAGAAMYDYIVLCGSMFDLPIWRHRKFVVRPVQVLPVFFPPCEHHRVPKPIDVTGTGSRRKGSRPDGRGGDSRKPRNIEEARAALGIDWMTRRELSQAIPPAYTKWLGRALLSHLSPVLVVPDREEGKPE